MPEEVISDAKMAINFDPAVASCRRSASVIVIFVIAFVFLSLSHPNYTDDTFITLSYARTLATSGTWGMFPGHIANGATSPLNVVLLAAAGMLAGSYTVGAILLAAMALTVVLVAGAAIGQLVFKDGAFGGLAFIGLAANPLLLSSIGLEGPVFAALLVLVLYALLAERWVLLGIGLGLLVLTRADGALLVFLIGVDLSARRQLRLSVAAVAVAVTLPWFLFSWLHLGSLVPDTLFFKSGLGGFRDGLSLYVERGFGLAVVASFAFMLFVPLGLTNRTSAALRLTTILLAYATIHYITYSALNVWPHHWYYLQEAIPIVLVGALGVCNWRARVVHIRARVLTGAAMALPLGFLVLLLGTSGLSLREPLIHSNWATVPEYVEIARWLNAHGTEPIAVVRAEVGTLAFHSERVLINGFSDLRSANREIAPLRTPPGGWFGTLLRLNFLRRETDWDQRPDPRLSLTGIYPAASADPSGTVMGWTTGTRWLSPVRIVLVENHQALLSSRP